MNEFDRYVSTLKRIADRHYGKEVLFYDSGEWYSRDHCRNLTTEEVCDYVFELSTESITAEDFDKFVEEY